LTMTIFANRMVDRTCREAARYLLTLCAAIRSPLRNLRK
jgi:hypothetical protein